jgi:hypothetical protein
MRPSARQENPSLSNTEVSRLLGKMWKEVPGDIKVRYKQQASALQDQFKKEHPDYTYRKARRKRALNELLAKSAQGTNTLFPGMQDPLALYQQFAQQGLQQPTGLYPGMGVQGQQPVMYPMQEGTFRKH